MTQGGSERCAHTMLHSGASSSIPGHGFNRCRISLCSRTMEHLSASSSWLAAGSLWNSLIVPWQLSLWNKWEQRCPPQPLLCCHLRCVAGLHSSICTLGRKGGCFCAFAWTLLPQTCSGACRLHDAPHCSSLPPLRRSATILLS